MTQNTKMQLAALTNKANTFMSAAAIMEEYAYVVGVLIRENNELKDALDKALAATQLKADQNVDTQTDLRPVGQSQ